MRKLKLIVWGFIFATGINQVAIPVSEPFSRDYREAMLIEKYFIDHNPSIAKSPRILKEIRSFIAYKKNLSRKYGLDLYVELVRPMYESCTFERPNALTKGHSGETGWEQIMPKTGKDLGYTKAKLKILRYNLECGAKFYKDLLTMYRGDYARALAYYNGGWRWCKINDAIRYSNRIIALRNDLVHYLNQHL